MLDIAVILGSTRPGRNGAAVAEWVHDRALGRGDAKFELIDVGALDLPMLDEPVPPSVGEYVHPHTREWANTVAGFDGFVFVTAEYNHSIPAALKNAIDFVYAEWNNKAAGFVGYGISGGVRAVEHLRLVMAELQVADVRSQVSISVLTDFENYVNFHPAAHHEQTLDQTLDQVVAWSAALRGLRAAA